MARLEMYRTVLRLEGEWTSASEATDKLRRMQRALADHGFRLCAARTARIVDEETLFDLAEPLDLDPDV
jgi:hypothetical protein